MSFLDFKDKGIFPRINSDGSKSFRIVIKYKDVNEKWKNKEYTYNLSDNESDHIGFANAVNKRNELKKQLEENVKREKNKIDALNNKKSNITSDEITFSMLAQIWINTKIKRGIDLNGNETIELLCSKSHYETSKNNIEFYNTFRVGTTKFGDMLIKDITSDIILEMFNYIESFKMTTTTIKAKGNPRDTIAKYGYRYNVLRKKLNINCCSLTNLLNGKNIQESFAVSFCEKTGIPFSEMFEKNISEKQYSDNTIYGWKKTIRTIFSFAVETKHWLNYNPAISKNILKYNTSEKKLPSMTDEEALLFFETSKEFDIYIRVPMRFQLLTTCRPEETAGLNIEDVDLENKTITINKAFVPGFLERKETKTKSSRRVIVLPDILVEEMKEYEIWREQFKADIGDVYQDDGQFFCSSTGKRLNRDSLLKMFKRVRDKAGLPNCYTTYSTRHTNITLLAESGIDINTLATIAGHGDTKTTTRYYVSTSMNAKRIAAEKTND